jgi:hypothetical protein
MRSILSLLMVLCLSACASTRVIHSDVTTFNRWSLVEAGTKTLKFVPTPEQAASLEYKMYEDLVRDRLLGLGFTEAADAQLAVELDYGLSSRDVLVRETDWYNEPRMGWYGPIGRMPSGRPLYGWGYDPFWPWAAKPITRESTQRVWRRELRIDMHIAATGTKVYEGAAVSEGSTDQLNPIMPYLVEALFSDFPGGNGVTRRVDVPIEAH